MCSARPNECLICNIERRTIWGIVPTFASERRWLVLFVLCIAVFLVVVDNTIVNVALPTISRDLHASNSSLQWIVDGYSLPFAGLLLAGGGSRTVWAASASCR